jgi:MMP 1-O-methyltransferase
MSDLTRDAIERILEQIHGFVQSPDLFALATYASRVQPPLNILEIGAYQGLSSVCLAQWAKVHVFSVDWHAIGDGDDYVFCDDDRRLWTQNVLNAGLADRLCPINMDSKQVAKGWTLPLGLLFIDGGHSYAAVRSDVTGFLPFVVPGGIVAFHDHPKTEDDQPNSQVYRAIQQFPELERLSVENITGFYRRRG